MKLHDCLVVLHEQMLDNELSPVRQNLGQLREGSRLEIGFRLVMTGERVRAFDNPVDLIVDMLEKAGAIALLETFEQLPDVGFGNHKCLLWLREQPARLRAESDDCVRAQYLDPRASFIQYMIEDHSICFGDDNGATSHQIFPGCRRGAAFHEGSS